MTEGTAAVDRDYLRLVGRRVRASRVLVGLSQDELARRAVVSRVTLGSIERGDHAAGLLTYVRLAGALPVSMGALLDVAPTGADRTEGLPS